MGNQSYKLSCRLKSYHPEDKKRYSWDDRGMCRLYSDVFRDILRYNSTAKEWYMYDGRIWKEDREGMYAQKKAKIFVEALVIYSNSIKDDAIRIEFLKLVSKYGQYRGRKTLVDDARSEEVITQADLDSYDNLYNCKNGIFDLDTFQLIPHDPKYLLSKISNVVYDPSSKSESWELFVSQIMEDDAEKIRYIQKLFGISLTTDTSIERMVIIYGPTTRNGKSTILEIIVYMHGGSNGYALTMPPETLAQKKNKDSRQASGDIARLDGCRFLVTSEPPKRMLFDAALLKTMIGRDTITARNLFQREFMFTPKFTLVMNTNYLPYVQDETLFTSGRIDVLPFNRHFTPEEQDLGLKDRLKEEKTISAIFNWCLEGLKLYREEGLIPPDSVTGATEDYRKNSDKLALFIEECLIKTGKNTTVKDIFTCYSAWCRGSGLEAGGRQSFTDDLRSRGLYAEHGTVNGVTKRNIMLGYEIASDEDSVFEEETGPDDELPWS